RLFFLSLDRSPPRITLFPYTTLFRSEDTKNNISISKEDLGNGKTRWSVVFFPNKGLQNVGSKLSGLSSAKFGIALTSDYQIVGRSEEHTSELQSRFDLVCRLLLEKKN